MLSPQLFPIHPDIVRRRLDTCVPQQFLDSAEIAPIFMQMRGETRSEQMRILTRPRCLFRGAGNPLESSTHPQGGARIPIDYFPYRTTLTERFAVTRHKQCRRFTRPGLTTYINPFLYEQIRSVSNGYIAIGASLAGGHENDLIVQDIAYGEPYQLARPNPRIVRYAHHDVVAKTYQRRKGRSGQQASDFFNTQISGQSSRRPLRSRKAQSIVFADVSPFVQPAIKGAQRRKLTINRAYTDSRPPRSQPGINGVQRWR